MIRKVFESAEATASSEQSSTSNQISSSIESISSVTEHTARGIGRIAQSAEDLNRLTDSLYSLVGQFKIEEEYELMQANEV